jgi:hypothetical protein
MVVMLLLRLSWGWWVGREMERKLDDLRRQGHPVKVEDIALAQVGDEENAWTWQTKAAKALVEGVDSPRNSNMEYPGYPPYSAEWLKLAEASEKAHGESFRLARKARELVKVQMRKELGPTSAYEVSHLNDANSLSNVIADGAQYKQTKGADEEAMERLLDILHISRSMRHDPFVISQLVAMGIDAKACNSAQIMGPELRAGDFREGSKARQKLTEVVHRLLEESELARRLAMPIDTERVWWMMYSRSASKNTWVIRPLVERDLARMLFNFDVLHEAAIA